MGSAKQRRTMTKKLLICDSLPTVLYYYEPVHVFDNRKLTQNNLISSYRKI